MSIHQWPASERPREKLVERGPASLSDAELLALLFRQGRPGLTALDLARQALVQHGGLRGLLSADYDEFTQIPGLGLAAYSVCQAVLELGRRYWSETLTRETAFTHPESCRQYLIGKLRHQYREIFAALFLDRQYRLIRYEELFQGTIHSTEVHPRILVQRALQHNAAAIILAHNHPSGCSKPSPADIQLTKALSKLLADLDIELLDHFIVGENTPVSLKEQGYF